MQIRLDGKLALLYSMLILQVLIVMIYVASTPPAEVVTFTTRNSVSFVKFQNSKVTKSQLYHKISFNFKTIIDKISLKDTKAIKLFRIYNRTLCFRSGVDNRRMQNEKPIEKCICNQGWHGSDCGQPEVAWRAIMASKQNVKLKRRKNVRRIIYVFCLNDYDSVIAEAIIEELYNVVDLFVVCDFSNAENNFRHRLTKGHLQMQHKKILYINAANMEHLSMKSVSKYLWDKVHNVVHNLRDDDVYAITNSEQILNFKALMFLKIYDGWPQPIGFRLRLSVFGFFWQHPLKTTIIVGACTLGLMHEAFSANSLLLQKQVIDETSERETLGLVVGDLNHYGGWYCLYCESPANIVNSLYRKNNSRLVNVEKNIDVPFVEDLIGGGIWLDGKTNLLRAYRSREPYFAPEVVLNDTGKYDWLLDNFYAKLDYY